MNVAPASYTHLTWQERLDLIVQTMRDISTHTDPNEMVNAYGESIQKLLPRSGYLSLSRRDLTYPQYRVTRYSGWAEEPDPWKNRDKLPLLSGGLVADVFYGGQPKIITLDALGDDDPAYEYLRPFRSAVAVPHFDGGRALNMVMILFDDPDAFQSEQLPELVWTSNLFGRGVHSLVLRRELQTAYDAIDRELQVVAEIQRGLLPTTLPKVPGLTMAAAYETSRRAGGDYYDFFELPDGKLGIFIADVSGHGTPAAVVMAITHSLAHAFPGPVQPPGHLLSYVNRKLASGVTPPGTFVTAFYAIYDPATRTLEYASAGHPGPRWWRAGSARPVALTGGASLPLGIIGDADYEHASQTFSPGDVLLMYTDGITEAFSPSGEMLGNERLDDLIVAGANEGPKELLNRIMAAVDRFTSPKKAEDDRTMIAMQFTA